MLLHRSRPLLLFRDSSRRQFVAHSPVRATCPACPEPEPALPSCCHPPQRVVQFSCCHVSEAAQPDSRAQHQPPATPQPRCDFCVEKSVATPPESGPSLESPQPTGELIPVALLGLTTLPLEHLGLLGGLDPHEWTGVDTRSECLFDATFCDVNHPVEHHDNRTRLTRPPVSISYSTFIGDDPCSR